MRKKTRDLLRASKAHIAKRRVTLAKPPKRKPKEPAMAKSSKYDTHDEDSHEPLEAPAPAAAPTTTPAPPIDPSFRAGMPTEVRGEDTRPAEKRLLEELQFNAQHAAPVNTSILKTAAEVAGEKS